MLTLKRELKFSAFQMNKIVYSSFVYGLPLVILTMLNIKILWALYMVPVDARRNSRKNFSNAQVEYYTNMLSTVVLQFFSADVSQQTP